MKKHKKHPRTPTISKIAHFNTTAICKIIEKHIKYRAKRIAASCKTPSQKHYDNAVRLLRKALHKDTDIAEWNGLVADALLELGEVTPVPDEQWTIIYPKPQPNTTTSLNTKPE